MYPKLHQGQHVLSFNWFYFFFSPKKGDIVIARVKKLKVIKKIKKVRGDEIFLEGENKKESTDSRSYGWINKKQILGKVFLILK